jgi:hypothetical protein
MKITTLFILVIAGCILAAGCVVQTKNTTENGTTVYPDNTFTPFAATTTPSLVSNESGLLNESPLSIIPNTTVKPGLNGLLRVSIGALDTILPVSVDNKSFGNVTKVKPLELMLAEGNHTVQVCCGILCEQENVTIKFGKQQTVDFSEQIKKTCEFFEPTVRIVRYSPNGDMMTVEVEFINPTAQTVTMSAEITVGYSFIDDRSNNREGNFATGQLTSTLKPSDRMTRILNLYLYSSGSSYTYNIPVITKVSTT